MSAPGKRAVPALLWLWAPLAIVPLQVLSKGIGEEFYRASMRGELGFVENATTAMLLACVVLALLCFRMRERVRSRLFGPLMLAFAVGCFFFAGEEASWGQHWFGFEPPEEIAQRNDQGEFNLHNDPLLEKLLDQPPRLALTLAALVGGIVAPLVRRRRGLRDHALESASLWGWVWPPLICLPAALAALTVSLPKKVAEAAGSRESYYLDISPGETKEFCLAVFLLVYVASLWLALRARAPASGG